MISLSYSKWSAWNKCPRRFKLDHIDQLFRAEPSPAMIRGSDIHSNVEHFLLGQTDELHPDIREYYGQFLTNLRNAGAIPEQKIAIDPLWKLVDWDGETYCRSVIDCHLPMREDGVVDAFEWKTGKMYPEHAHQVELYAVKLKVLYPKAKQINVTGVYFDLKRNGATYLHPDYYQEMKIELWDNNFRKILRDEVFEPNPSYGCKFCPHSSVFNGGSCEF